MRHCPGLPRGVPSTKAAADVNIENGALRAPRTLDINSLLGAVVARISRELARDVARLGVSLPGARLLGLLGGRGTMRCSEIATALGLDAPTLSHLLRSLADRELIVRQRSKNDNRAVEVRLTAQGERLARQCRDIETEAQRGLLRGLDESDVARLGEMLARMDNNLGVRRA